MEWTAFYALADELRPDVQRQNTASAAVQARFFSAASLLPSFTL
jgi:hypothetical protein